MLEKISKSYLESMILNFTFSRSNPLQLVNKNILILLAVVGSIFSPFLTSTLIYILYHDYNELRPTQSFKLLFTFFVSVPGMVTIVDVLKHGSSFAFPSIIYILSSMFLWLDVLIFKGHSNLSSIAVLAPYAKIYFSGMNNFTPFFWSIEGACIFTYLFYTVLLNLNKFIAL